MKQGMSLTKMAQELERQQASKRDFVANTGALTYIPPVEGKPESIALDGTGQFGIRPYAHGQIAEHLEIPKKYYDRMHEGAPALLATNVNYWFRQNSSRRRMVRTLDGNVRAFLSDRYRPLDNFDLAQAALPTLMEDTSLQIASCAITETHLYIKAVTEKIQLEVRRGDVVQAGAASLNETKFRAIVERWQEATEKRIAGDLPEVLEVTAKRFSLNDGERGSILRSLIEEGDLTMYGLANAITSTSRELQDYDRATELERIGGQVIELPSKDWKMIAEAA